MSLLSWADLAFARPLTAAQGSVCGEATRLLHSSMTRFATLLLCSWSCVALTLQTEANPIRKVVTILQTMQKEIEAEGDIEEKAFDKFMCYCECMLTGGFGMYLVYLIGLLE